MAPKQETPRPLSVRKADWRPMLAACLLHNEAAAADPQPGGGIRIKVPTKPPRGLFPPLSWLARTKPFKILELDALGHQVWRSCGPGKTVEQIIDDFAGTYRLTFHESRVAVTGFIKTLVQRGALVVVMRPPEGS